MNLTSFVVIFNPVVQFDVFDTLTFLNWYLPPFSVLCYNSFILTFLTILICLFLIKFNFSFDINASFMSICHYWLHMFRKGVFNQVYGQLWQFKSKKRTVIFWVIFFIILITNYVGQFTITKALTAYLLLPLVLSGWVNILLNFLVLTGTLLYSYIGYFVPHGMQLYMVPGLWLIEVISHFVKCLSLAIRLFANIFAGHVLLHIFFNTVVDILRISIMLLLSSAALLICTLLQLLELFVSFLQAYVFTLLSTQYFGDINDHMRYTKIINI